MIPRQSRAVRVSLLALVAEVTWAASHDTRIATMTARPSTHSGGALLVNRTCGEATRMTTRQARLRCAIVRPTRERQAHSRTRPQFARGRISTSLRGQSMR
jgi:hypothetical protein